MRRLILACALLAAAPVASQVPAGLPEGRFVDSAGRSVQLTLGAPGPGFQLGNRSVADLAAEFKRLCVDTALNKPAFDAAVAASTFGWRPDPYVQTFGRKGERTLDFGGWKTDDAGIRLIDFGDMLMRGLQCNLTAALGAPADRAIVTAALAGVAGVDPADPAQAKAMKRGQFELPVAGGTILLMSGIDNQNPHLLHLGALLRPVKTKR